MPQVLVNTACCVLMLMAKLIQCIVFGPLRVSERQVRPEGEAGCLDQAFFTRFNFRSPEKLRECYRELDSEFECFVSFALTSACCFCRLNFCDLFESKLWSSQAHSLPMLPRVFPRSKGIFSYNRSTVVKTGKSSPGKHTSQNPQTRVSGATLSGYYL